MGSTALIAGRAKVRWQQHASQVDIESTRRADMEILKVCETDSRYYL